MRRFRIAAIVGVGALLLSGCATSSTLEAVENGADERALSVCEGSYGTPEGALLGLEGAVNSTVSDARSLAIGSLRADFDSAFASFDDSDYVALCHLNVEGVEDQTPTGNAVVAIAESVDGFGGTSAWIGLW